MRILMVNAPFAPRFRGGDTTQIEATARCLRACGDHVVVATEPAPDAAGFDIVHLFNCRAPQATGRQLTSIKASGVPVLLSPIYVDLSLARWGSAAVPAVFAASTGARELADGLERIKRREIVVRTKHGVDLSPTERNRPTPDYDDQQRSILSRVDHLLPNSYMEMDKLMKSLGAVASPWTVIPYAADPAMFAEPDPEWFVDHYGIRDFILQVGRVEQSKNQLLLAHATKLLNLGLVLIGPCVQESYLNLCRAFGPRRLLHIPWLPHDRLASAYAAARIHALPSWSETCGLTTMEAALAGTSVIASTGGCEVEYFRNLVDYCDPWNAQSLIEALQRSLADPDRNGERRRRLRELILADYTWDRAARLTRDAYISVLEGRSTCN